MPPVCISLDPGTALGGMWMECGHGVHIGMHRPLVVYVCGAGVGGEAGGLPAGGQLS